MLEFSDVRIYGGSGWATTQAYPANSVPAARGYGDPRRPNASCRENSSKSTFSYRTPVQCR